LFSVDNPSSTKPGLLAKILVTPPLEPMGYSYTSCHDVDVGLFNSNVMYTDLASQRVFLVLVTRSHGSYPETDLGFNPADNLASGGAHPRTPMHAHRSPRLDTHVVERIP
jgi:hypothetical protein